MPNIIDSHDMGLRTVLQSRDCFTVQTPKSFELKDEKRRRYNVRLVSHGSVTAACLEEKALTMRPDKTLTLRSRQTRDQRNKR
ncbi:hypothetical protein TNCV_2016131 [Trichonephila clavipes]|nr:hypothetical protein TNCV_2016131 [Trichonephila clavipes]